VRVPTARAAGVAGLEIVIDTRERYPYRFSGRQAHPVRQALPCGDYGLVIDGRLVAAVERKSLPDLVSGLTGGRLRYAVADLAALPRAAVVVEDRYSQVFALERVRPAVVADGLAELQVRWPEVPIVFAQTRTLAEEWTYRYLAAARVWAASQDAAARIGPGIGDLDSAPAPPGPTTAEIRVWAREQGLSVSDRGRLRSETIAAWHAAHPAP